MTKHEYDMWDEDGRTAFVSAEERKRQLQKVRKQLERDGVELHPVEITGRKIAKTFWGRAWSRHIEQWQDYASRLPRGRSYVLQGAVLDLRIGHGEVKALVSGQELYHISIRIEPVSEEQLARLRRRCAGKLNAWMDLVRGELSEEVIEVLCDPDDGIFPQAGEVRLICDCPDWADLCKHLAAVLYAVGARLDQAPELLFVLRGIDAENWFGGDPDAILPEAGEGAALSSDELSAAFGIELD